jgi:uncharacterized protein YecE (DUF72 family)
MPLGSEMELVASSALDEQQSSRVRLVDEAIGRVPDLRDRSRAGPLRIGELSVGELEVAARSIRLDRSKDAHDVAVPQRCSAPDALELLSPADIGPVDTPSIDERPARSFTFERAVRGPRDVELRVGLQGNVVELGKPADGHAVSCQSDALRLSPAWPGDGDLGAPVLHAARLISDVRGPQRLYVARMPATVRLGTCSFADEGLVKTWYPRGVSTSKARLAYYSERFDTVEVDSPYYHLPDPDVTGRWAQRTPPEFVFHVKAHKTMTWHEGEPTDEAFAEFRASIAPLELSGKLRGILLQYHPRFVKSPDALAELERVLPRIDPLVPLIEFRHRSWMEPEERADTLAFLERNGLAYVSVDTPMTRASNVIARHAVATHPTAYVRFHGRNAQTWNIKSEKSSDRFDWMYGPEELVEWVEKLDRLSSEADEVYALFNNNRDDFAPRSAVILRGLLDEAGIPAVGGIEPPPVTPTLF